MIARGSECEYGLDGLSQEECQEEPLRKARE